MRKKSVVTWLVILGVIILAIWIMNKPIPVTDAEVAKCIGKEATLYIQLGCHACETQEKLFGDNLQYIDIVDCWFSADKCEDIRVTPTWKINGKLIEGVQSIVKLQELTGCE